MIDKLLELLTRALYEKNLRKEVEETIARDKETAGDYVAARYTRGNVAIQQGRFNTDVLHH